MSLLYAFNLKNTVNLIIDLLEVPSNTSTQLVLFGVINMYTNIVIKDFLDVIKLMYDRKNINVNLGQEKLNMCKIMTQQNYFYIIICNISRRRV